MYQKKLSANKQNLLKDDFFADLQFRCQRVLLLFLATGELPPTCPLEVEALEKHLHEKINQGHQLNPAWLSKTLKVWQERILASGVPPALKSGFLSL